MRNQRHMILHLPLGLLLLTAFVPVIMMLILSLRPTLNILIDYWGWSGWPHWDNYQLAWEGLGLSLFNTFIVSIVAVAGVLFTSLTAGYAFARLDFFGKKLLYALIMCLMMVPGILLLAPRYVLAMDFGLRGSYWGLWFFYISHGQVLGIFLLRMFLETIPEDYYEAARIDGASEWVCLFKISLPLCYPILATVGIHIFLTVYNDLIWPMLIISNPQDETLMLALLRFAPVDSQMGTGRTDIGAQVAGYVFASVPVVIIFWIGMKAYIRGVITGGIKG